MTEYRLFREDTKEAFHLGEDKWIKAFPFSGKHQQIPFKMESYHKTPEALAKVLKRVYGPYLEDHHTEEFFLAIARRLFEWCGSATLLVTNNDDLASWAEDPWGQYKVTADLTAKEPEKPAYCGRPRGEFGVGYEGATGPLWDNVCAQCLPGAIRKLDVQIQQWQKADVSSYPGGIRVEVSENVTACDFDPNEGEKVTTNPEG